MSDDNDGDVEDYEVGYGKPPKKSQFRPGQSGNPKGRRKGTRNFKTDLSEELSETITVKENGKAKSISKQRALIKANVNKAMKGDARATQIVLQYLSEWLEQQETSNSEHEVISNDDQAILDAFSKRILRGKDK